MTLLFARECGRVTGADYEPPEPRRSTVERRLHDKVQFGGILLPSGRTARLAGASIPGKLLNEFRKGLL